MVERLFCVVGVVDKSGPTLVEVDVDFNFVLKLKIDTV